MSALFTAERTERAYSVCLCISVCLSIGSANTYLHLSVYRFCLYLSVGLSVLPIPIYICRSIGSVYTYLHLSVYRFCLYLSISVGLSVLSIPIYICRYIGSVYTYLRLFCLLVYRFCLYLSISGGLSVYVLYLYLSTSVLPIGLQVLSIPIYICRSVGLSVLPIPIHICSAYRSISSAYTYPHLFCLSVYQFCLSIWKRNETPPVNPSIKQ